MTVNIRLYSGTVANLSSGSTNTAGASVSQAFIQYNHLIVGLTETAFSDPAIVNDLNILDLAGPSGVTTILSPIKANGQGRISYVFTDDVNLHTGWVGCFSIEQPVPEIQNVNGTAATTTNPVFYTPLAHYPDLIGSIRYADIVKVGNDVFDIWHLQFGSVLRDISMESSDNTVHQSVFGWGLGLSGFCAFGPCDPGTQDGIAASATCGAGIGHYVNDLHLVPDGVKVGGNDAFYNPATNTFGCVASAGLFHRVHPLLDGQFNDHGWL